jgi:hypothetical protein
LARYAASGADLSRVNIDEKHYLSLNSYAFSLLDSFTDPNVVRILPYKRLCHDGVCDVYADGTPLYYDEQHLSVSGAEYLAPLFEDLFQGPVATKAPL